MLVETLLDAEVNLTTQNTSAVEEPASNVRRRIVYNTSLSLVVEKYVSFETAFTALVDSHDGFISKSETQRAYEDRQSGVWVARIPVEKYSAFIGEAVDLGFAESRSENADDVTAEFVDIEARIQNSQQLESRIIEMLEERAGKLSDVLEIERELSRVREEVERMQGRLRVLADQSSLATITVRVREEREYIPAKAPTLRTRLASSWSGSLYTLRRTGEGLLVAGVAIAPWLISGAIVFGLLVVPIRIARRRWKQRVSN